ncbi:MAG: PGPGW domain-containing protein [Pirellulales bacterium]
MESVLEWAKSHDALLWWLFAASIATYLLTPLAAAGLVIRLPTDYFAAKRRQIPAWWDGRGWLRPLVVVVKNLAGVALLLAGLVMLVVPGQGLLTIVAGLMLVDFPGKYRLERWLATRPPVWRSLNWLRKRARREPLQRPE